MDSIVFGPLIISRIDWLPAITPHDCHECGAFMPGTSLCAYVRSPRGEARLCAPCGRALEADACTPS